MKLAGRKYLSGDSLIGMADKSVANSSDSRSGDHPHLPHWQGQFCRLCHLRTASKQGSRIVCGISENALKILMLIAILDSKIFYVTTNLIN